MSAIGEYIHLHTENYLTYGTARKGSKFSEPSLAEAYRAQKQKNLERINSLPSVKGAVLAELKKRVAKNLPEGKDAARESLDLALAEQKLSDRFKNFLLTNIDGNILRQSKIKNFSSITTNNELVAIEEAKRLRNNLYKNIETLNQRFSKGLTAGATPETIAKNFTDYFKALGMALPEGGYVIRPEDIDSTDVLTALKRISQDVSFAQADKATLHGQWGEKTVQMCGDAVVRKSLETLNGVIVGSTSTSFKMNESIIPKSVGQTFLADTGINLYRAYSTPNKVDVQIVVNKKPLNVSVKAYTARNNSLRVHLQDVSLMTSLATTVSNFANHWLNLHSLNLSSNLLDSALEEHIKYEALVSGNLLKQGASLADTFVAIDVVSGRVFSASTKDILNNKTSSNFYLSPRVGSIAIGGNKLASSWEQRISNILQSVHAVKINVGLNISLKSS